MASRSIIATLRAVDPGAELIRDRTMDEVLAARPEAREYFHFAFLRHPVDRIRSFYADKHTLGSRDRDVRRWFIEPWYGVSAGMGFAAFCRWLETPFGSDAFADRHWLSQHCQVRDADGRLPDFLGCYERLDADWRAVCERLGVPFRPPAPAECPAAGQPRNAPRCRRGRAAAAALCRGLQARWLCRGLPGRAGMSSGIGPGGAMQPEPLSSFDPWNGTPVTIVLATFSIVSCAGCRSTS